MAWDRRQFIRGLLASAAAAAVLDPKELLWIPGAKLVSVPAIVRAARVATGGGLTDGERRLCAQMGISEAAFALRRAEMHRKNPQLPPRYFRMENAGRFTELCGGSTDDGIDFVKSLFPARFKVGG